MKKTRLVSYDLNSLKYNSKYTAEESLEMIKTGIDELKRQGCSDIRFEIEAESSYNDSPPEVAIFLTGKRPETDAEEKSRIKEEAARAELEEKRRRNMYEQLKKIYEASDK